MRIGAVVAEDGDTIVPLPDGPTVKIFDQQAGSSISLPNPSRGMTKGRREAVTRLLLEQGVEAVCAPPATFCPVSYARATEGGLRFLRVDPGTRFSEVIADLNRHLERLEDALPEEELFQPRLHHGH